MKRGIEINSLSRSFGGIRAVDAIDLKVRHNTIFGLIGPDGAGKTTLMRMLCSLMKPDSGTAQIGGLDIRTQGDEIINHLGYMPQRFSLYGDLTVMENLRFYSDIYQVPADVREQKIEYLLEFSRLKKHSEKLADQLSGGMKQKLALCCNLIHTPDFLLLDEEDQIIGDAVAYRDRRTEGMDSRLEERLPYAEHYALTGIAKQPFNTVYQLMSLP